MADSPYAKKLKEKYGHISSRLEAAKDKFSSPSTATAEEIYGRIGDSLSSSLSKEDLVHPKKLLDVKEKKTSGQPLSRSFNSPSEESAEVLRSTPIDDTRNLEVRYNAEDGKYEYAATKIKHPKRSKWEWIMGDSPDTPPPIPRKSDIASLSMYDDGRVSIVRSGYDGAKEGAVDRLLMEATKDGFTPSSTSLLPAGKKMVARKAVEFQETAKEAYLNKIRKFLETGKTGKIWGAVAPMAKPLGYGLTALGALGNSDMAGAATDIVIPGGTEDAGQNDFEVMGDRKYRQNNLIPNTGMLGDYTTDEDSDIAYLNRVRKLNQRKP